MDMTMIKYSFFVLFFSSAVYSADFEKCKVLEVVASGPINGHVQLDCNITPRPVCATVSNFFGFNKSTEEGKHYLSLALTAFASNGSLTGFIDDNQCPAYQSNIGLLQHLRLTK